MKDQSLQALEHRLTEIDAELKNLAQITLRNGTGSVGYRSKDYNHPEQSVWFHVDLGREVMIDQVVLVPALFRDPEMGVRAEGFPEAFRIHAGDVDEQRVVASRNRDSGLMPRLSPVAISFAPIKASRVSIEATHLSPRISDGKYMLQLSEIMVFSGMKNVALHRWVKLGQLGSDRYRKQSLTDGFTPYRMDAAYGQKSQASGMRVKSNPPEPYITIDLGKTQVVDGIMLHSADLAHSIPMEQFSTWGVPRHLRVTASLTADFSSEELLFEDVQKSMYDTGPIVMRQFKATPCRYVRLYIVDSQPVISLRKGAGSGVAFSEIEVLSGGENVARRALVESSDNLDASPMQLKQLTDGLNYYGSILPIREWLNQLAKRHDLEKERPLIVAELTRRYTRQKKVLQILIWTAALLAAGTVIAILVGQKRQQLAISNTRKRIAANLHDELGANLHAIGLFGDLAKKEAEKVDDDAKRNKLNRYLEEVRALTEHAGKTARYTTNMLEAKELYENPIAEMRRTAEHLLTDIEHHASFEDEELLQLLSPRRRAGIVLFYRECLTNVLRHSGASKVTTRLSAHKKIIQLAVSDNGKGLQQKATPASLKRRARLLKAKLEVGEASEGETQITLQLKRRRWEMRNREK